jgi:hypothetical protein
MPKIKEKWMVSVSTTTLKSILKSFSMSWRRLRRLLAGKPDPVEYETKRQQLEAKVDRLLAKLTSEIIASVTGYSFILDALSDLDPA